MLKQKIDNHIQDFYKKNTKSTSFHRCPPDRNNLQLVGKLVYAPIYMIMFLERRNDAPTYYKIDLSELG